MAACAHQCVRGHVRAKNFSPQGNRRSIRLQGYDYSQAETYFVSVCGNNRACLFVEIAHRQMVLTDAGRMMEFVCRELPVRFDHIELDESGSCKGE